MTAIALTLAMPAAAQFVTIVEAHEVALSEIRLPGHPAGTMSFKACKECEYQTVRVSPNTRYVVDGKSVTLEKFRRAAATVRERSMKAVTVKQHLRENVITAIEINL